MQKPRLFTTYCGKFGDDQQAIFCIDSDDEMLRDDKR